MDEQFSKVKDDWESHDDWQFADRDAERRYFFNAGLAKGRKEGLVEAAGIVSQSDLWRLGDGTWLKAKLADAIRQAAQGGEGGE